MFNEDSEVAKMFERVFGILVRIRSSFVNSRAEK